MKYLFLAIFIISSSIHLYASFKSNSKLRAQTKGIILLALLGWYCFSVSDPLPIVTAAILTSWLGDVLLIPKGVTWFSAGGISFLISHICFVAAYAYHVDFSVVPLWLIIAAAVAYIAVTALVFRGLRPYLPKKLFYPMAAYLLANSAMNCFALYQLVSLPCLATAVTFIGAVLFFISDSTLFYVRFKKDGRLKTHFIVMLTYILAEFLIVEGFVLLAI